jgi:hypothetical protein
METKEYQIAANHIFPRVFKGLSIQAKDRQPPIMLNSLLSFLLTADSCRLIASL